jgi:tight adherence protein C
MTAVYAALSMTDLLPVIVFGAIVGAAWFLMTALSKRTSAAEERLARLGRPDTVTDMNMGELDEKKQRFKGIKEAIASLGGAMEGKSDLEKDKLRLKLMNAGIRSDKAPMVYHGIRLLVILLFLLPVGGIILLNYGFSMKGIVFLTVAGGIAYYMPPLGLHFLVTGRQKDIFLTLPDALDLLVVCVESGLGLDAAMRKVTDEMKNHAKTISEEFALANLQLQMGRPRREVLHDLGVRTGVDDVKALAAILIQADRFGSSIAQALRVQSDSMRVRRRQIAEEKAAKTAVQLIFPLVLFIFPAIFVVLCGPAAIQIQKGLLKEG